MHTVKYKMKEEDFQVGKFIRWSSWSGNKIMYIKRIEGNDLYGMEFFINNPEIPLLNSHRVIKDFSNAAHWSELYLENNEIPKLVALEVLKAAVQKEMDEVLKNG